MDMQYVKKKKKKKKKKVNGRISPASSFWPLVGRVVSRSVSKVDERCFCGV